MAGRILFTRLDPDGEKGIPRDYRTGEERRDCASRVIGAIEINHRLAGFGWINLQVSPRAYVSLPLVSSLNIQADSVLYRMEDEGKIS